MTTQTSAENLMGIIADASMRALVQHAHDKGIDAVSRLDALREIVKAEYTELLDTLNSAIESNMPESMLRSIINTYVNAWAVKALRGGHNETQCSG